MEVHTPTKGVQAPTKGDQAPTKGVLTMVVAQAPTMELVLAPTMVVDPAPTMEIPLSPLTPLAPLAPLAPTLEVHTQTKQAPTMVVQAPNQKVALDPITMEAVLIREEITITILPI